MALHADKEFRDHPGIAEIAAFLAACAARGRPVAAFYADTALWDGLPARAGRNGLKIAGVPIRRAVVLFPDEASHPNDAGEALLRAAKAEAARRARAARGR